MPVSFEFLRGAILLVQLPGFLQGDQRQIRRHPQQKRFGRRRKIGPLRTGDQHADLIHEPEPEGRDPDFAVARRIRHGQRRVGGLVGQPAVERAADLIAGLLEPTGNAS